MVFSTAVVSPSLHSVVCHDSCHENLYLDSHENECDPCNENDCDEQDPHDEQDPNDEQHCLVVIFSQGITTPQAYIPEHWEYIDFQFIKFAEPDSLASSLNTLQKRQRAPPLA